MSRDVSEASIRYIQSGNHNFTQIRLGKVKVNPHGAYQPGEDACMSVP